MLVVSGIEQLNAFFLILDVQVFPVIPAKAGISLRLQDSCLRRNDYALSEYCLKNLNIEL